MGAGEVWRNLRDPAQVQAAVAEHRKDGWLGAGGSRGGDPQVRLGLGQVEDFGAKVKQGRRALSRVKPALVHFAEVGDELGFDAPRLAQELGQAAEKIAIGDRLEVSFVRHAPFIALVFLTL